ncbi:MAG TPA: hypothetical protein VG738_17105 [Chitinophagaceae bacterium]|nr:hypothetical protein [Chitinophagaceae bacterium]
MIRKIDFALQLVIVALFIFCLIWFSIAERSLNIFAFLVLPILSIWQLISAVLNLLLSHNQNDKKALSLYWKICLPSAALFISSLFFNQSALDNNDILPIFLLVAGLAGGVVASAYYLYIYKRYFIVNSRKRA